VRGRAAATAALVLVALAGAFGGCGDDRPVAPAIDDPPVEVPADSSGFPDVALDSLIAAYQLEPLPAAPYPRNNEYNPDRIRLGHLLFFDPILGGESAPWVKSAAGKEPYRYRGSDVACATCHMPHLGFADGRPMGVGISGGSDAEHLTGPSRRDRQLSIVSGRPAGTMARNSMTLLNTALNGRNSIAPTAKSFQFMDGRVGDGLEFQAFLPFADRDEMAGDAFGRPGLGAALTDVAVLDSLRRRVLNIPGYYPLWEKAFAPNVKSPADIRADQIPLAVAAYERELVTPGSRYDQFVAGAYDVFTTEERKGFGLFFTKGDCGSRHRGPMLSDYSFRCIGAGDGYDAVIPGFAGKNGQGGDFGRFHAFPNTGFDFGKYFFRVLTVRNVTETGPYFHSGAARTLREVVEFFNRGGRGAGDLSDEVLASGSATRDPAIRPLGLTDTEIDAIVAFLRTTSAPVRPGPDGLDLTRPPERVPSGLVPPGVPTPDGQGPFLPAGAVY
jgi:cytochrome c peroxidase